MRGMRTITSAAKIAFGYRLCRRIGLYVFLAIIVVEAAILIPSYRNYERDLLKSLESSAQAALSATFLKSSHASVSDLKLLGRILVSQKVIAGGILYDPHLKEIASFGMRPALTKEAIAQNSKVHHRSQNKKWYDISLTSDALRAPYSMIARLDASMVSEELVAFVWRILGLVLLISAVVCLATMIIVGNLILAPVIKLRENLIAAYADPDHVDRYVLENRFQDELHDVVEATNSLLHHVGTSYRDTLKAMSAMANQATDAILAYDEDGNILYANKACVKLTGFVSTKEMRQEHLPRFEFDNHEVSVSLPESMIADAYSREAQMIGKNGNRTAVVVNAARLTKTSKSPIRYYASITDISELRATQKKLEIQNAELIGANKAKSEFLANMSHELKTPLNAIIGFSSAFVSQMFGPLGSSRYIEYAGDIHNSGNHLLSIINDILDLAKIEAGRKEIQEERSSVEGIIGDLLTLMRERADQKNIDLSCSTQINGIMLSADNRMLKQMVTNLLSNAIKFTEDGGSVRIEALACKNTHTISIAVSDTGVGMDEEGLQLALQTFQQVDGSLMRVHEGTGLGLPLVKSFIDLHGGTLSLESEAGVGTTATLTFPPERTIVLDGERATA